MNEINEIKSTAPAGLVERRVMPEQFMLGTKAGKLIKVTIPPGEKQREGETVAGFRKRCGTYSTLIEA